MFVPVLWLVTVYRAPIPRVSQGLRVSQALPPVDTSGEGDTVELKGYGATQHEGNSGSTDIHEYQPRVQGTAQSFSPGSS